MELEHALKEWAVCGSDNVVLFDPTHGTNDAGLKLCCFVTISPYGQSVILAFALLDTESTDDIEWAFKMFHSVFKRAPAVLLTDGGGSIRAAYERMKSCGLWALVVHMLCVFHLSKDFYDHISPLVKDRSSFRELTNTFWNIAKETDLSTVSTFPEDWSRFVLSFESSVQDTDKGEKKYDNALAWLKGLGELPKARQYAYRFTSQMLTYLLRSTQRSEAINGAIKLKVSESNLKAPALVEGLLRYNEESRLERDVSTIRLAIRQHALHGSYPPYISNLRAIATPYAYELICSQAALSQRYRVEDSAQADDYCDGAFDVLHGQPSGDDDESMEDWRSKAGRVFIVSLYDTSQCNSRSVQVNDNGISQLTDDYEDAGLTPVAKRRITSLSKCSCQFDLCSGIDLCRHRIAVMGRVVHHIPQKHIYDFLGKSMAEKWRVQSSNDELDAVRALRNLPAPSIPNPPSASAGGNSKSDRYSLLMSELRVLAELGSESERLTEVLLQDVRSVISDVKDGSFLKSSVQQQLPTAYEAVKDAVQEVVKHNTADAVSLKAALGSMMEIDEDTDFDSSWFTYNHLSTSGLLGKIIAYKYKDVDKGGWHLAKVVEEIDPSQSGLTEVPVYKTEGKTVKRGLTNFVIKFSSDGKSMSALLLPHNFSDTPFEPSAETSWCLVHDKPLDDAQRIDVASATIQSKPKSSGRRASSKRKMPTNAGPTGKFAQRARGSSSHK